MEPKIVGTRRYKDPTGRVINLTVREGATPQMVKDTQAVFETASILLAAGKFVTPVNPSRPNYGDSPHDEARTLVYGDATVLTGDGATVTISLNKVTEYSTVQDILDNARLLLFEFPVEAPAKAAPKEPAVPDNRPPSVRQPVTNGTVRHFKNFPKREECSFADGETVSFDIVKIESVMNPTGVVKWQFYCPYGGKPGQHPAYPLSIYSDKEIIMNSDLGKWLVGLGLKPGGSITGEWVYTANTRLKEDKTYFNPTNIVAAAEGI